MYVSGKGKRENTLLRINQYQCNEDLNAYACEGGIRSGHSAAVADIARRRMSKRSRSNVQSGLIKTLMWHT